MLDKVRQKHEASSAKNASFTRASATLELALALPAARADEKRAALVEAKNIFDKIHQSSRNPDRRLRAGVMSTYMDAYEARAFGKELPAATVQNTYRGLTRLIEEHESLPKRDQVHTGGLRTEIEISALLISTGDPSRFPWPAFEREESSEIHQKNHDCFILSDGHKLPPIQIKRGGTKRKYDYDDDIATVIYEELEAPQYDQNLNQAGASYDPYERYRIYDPGDYNRRIVWGAGRNKTQFVAPTLADALITDSKGYKTELNQQILGATSLQLLTIIDEAVSNQA